ncbi:MAG: DUF2093 domain-containing protein [Pseudomonadota bacterium]
MNPFDGLGGGREAVLEYLDAEFRVVVPGEYVTCAVTQKRIPVDALKYWNVDKQEPYADAKAAIEGFELQGGEG